MFKSSQWKIKQTKNNFFSLIVLGINKINFSFHFLKLCFNPEEKKNYWRVLNVFWTLAQGFISFDTDNCVRWKLSVPDSQLSVPDLKRKTGLICHCTGDQQQSLFWEYIFCYRYVMIAKKNNDFLAKPA